MINRITESIKFNTIINNMYINQGILGKLEEGFSTQKKINRPSDDPSGTNEILDYRSAINAIEQYQAGITDADVSLSMAENVLSSIREIVEQAKTIALSQYSAGASDDTMDTLAETVSALIDEALSLMNTKQDDVYLFSGSSTTTEPFSATYQSAEIEEAISASTNIFNGTVASGGLYTETQNKTFALKIVEGGPLSTATYQISDDGGKTWGSIQSDLSLPITLGGGIDITFTVGTEDLASDDLFYVKGYTGGYYKGNDDVMSIQIGKNYSFIYNITGANAFTGPSANAEIIIGQEASLTENDTIVLTRGANSWSLANHPNYPSMNIVSQSATTINIDADGDAVADISLSLSGEWSENDTATFAVTAGTIPTLGAVNIVGSGAVDLLATLYSLQDALSSHNSALIGEQIDRLQALETQILKNETKAGAKRESLTTTSANHDSFKLQITNLLADIENADLTTLIMEFQMRQIAMQASYNMASKISQLTILNYIQLFAL